MIWKKINDSVLRSGDWSIIKWPWGSYCLWLGSKFVGRFNTADLAKEEAIAERDSKNRRGDAAALAGSAGKAA